MKTKQEQIEEMAVIGCVRNPQAHTAEECAKCDFKEGQCNAYRHAEALYEAGYRKVPDGAVVFTPDYLIAKIGNLGELKEKIGSLTSEKEGWKRRYIDSGQRNKRLSIKNAQLKAENEELKAELKQTSKETAEKIFGDLWNNFVEYSAYAMDYTQHLGECDKNINITVSDVFCDIICIAKNYGVDLEIEE